ncbi:glycosyltransferase [Bradymonadaceae bacterium TMQ3]|uniref:Glycosyltransferase n=1 Tax=Lujinxingia sediminis TaxID=2480984 RepID=A0ABY0CTU4_9DELT|nr:glycosyltransferase [Lujinxingia sediminis]RDV37570.1 glycosyltransferase [Bradymonadaceae bacterium TMQ3]RVU45745.1 glycosyltransferase [Lujinxingia sediminis]TXC75123.1 glycosyltransferase [Bradymonadales bacterium TMQ1]
MSNSQATDVELSIVIPIYNEELILESSVEELTANIAADPRLSSRTYELILSENGSSDNTVALAKSLQERFPQLRILHSDEPNYGLAMRRGIMEAHGEIVLCDEIDLCDTDFYARALEKIEGEGYDLVVGSKALDRSMDHRPAFRRLATRVLNGLFRVFLGFHGTDTHGLKAFRRQRLLDVIDRCVVDRDLFASEFVIRAERMNFRMTEIPVHIVEKRQPSIHLVRRVPNVLKNLGRLVWVIRVTNR